MFKDPRKWMIAAILAVAFAISFPAVYYRETPKTKISPQSNLVSLIKQVEPSVVYVEAWIDCNEYLWSGSGVIISENGLILTAGHVVDGAEAFKIMLSDSQEFWTDKSYLSNVADIGLIQIDANELPFSYLGNSSNLCKGERVFMIGNPFGRELPFTVTSGIISGLNRDIEIFGMFPVLQFGIHNFSGMSGCPIYNLKGQVISIHVGGRSGSCSISAGIPVDVIKKILDIYEAKKGLKNAGYRKRQKNTCKHEKTIW